MKREANLLLPALKLIHKEVVPLSNFGKLAIHFTFKVDKILPCFHGISRVLVAFSDNLIEVAHRDLRHQRLLHRTTENGFHTKVATLIWSVSMSFLLLKMLVKLPISRRHGP